MFLETLDYFIEDILRLPIRKALDPNDPKDFLAICNTLAKATAGLAQKDEAIALKNALAALDVDWKNMTPANKAKVVLAAKAAVNPAKAVLPKIEEHFEANAIKLGKQTKGSTKKTFGFSIEADLNTVQMKSLQAVAFSQGNYVRDEYGKRSDIFGMKAKQIITEELAKGSTQKEIAARLHQDLTAQQFNRSQAYWAVVANAFANRARTFTNLSSYEEAGITTFRFESVLDERTSNVCRFMHGRTFSVAAALDAHAKSEEGDVKEAMPWVSQTTNGKGEQQLYVKRPGGTRATVATITQSGMGKVDDTGKFSGRSDAGLQKLGVMTPPLHGHCRSTIVPGPADAKAPRAPKAPAAPPPPAAPAFALTPPPEFVPAPPPIVQPPAPPTGPVPQLGFQFGLGGIDNKPIAVPTLDPTKPPVMTLKEKAYAGLEKVLALKEQYGQFIPNLAPVQENKLLQDNYSIISQAFLDKAAAGEKPAFKKIESVKSPASVVDADKVKNLIKDPKALLNAEVKLVKIGKEVYIIEGHEALAAAHAKDQWKLKVLEVNLKQLQAENAAKSKEAASKPNAPPLPPKPLPPPTPLPPPPPKPLTGTVDPANILHRKYGAAAGSNEGGFYEGADGIKRYVKFYKDPAQAHGEVLANALYKALGQEAPEAVTWAQDGKQMYAAKLLDGQTLGSAGVTKANAKEFFKGFAADVLSANWDAAGMSVDNAFLLKNGKVARIDNGGCFLMRAKGGRKPESVLNGISEVDGFFPGGGVYNPGYHQLAKKAGYNSAADFKDDFKAQVEKISALRKQHGSWGNFVSQYSPGLTGADRDAVVKMLESRHALLEQKVAKLFEPPPPPPPPPPKPIPGQRPPPLKPDIGIGYQAPSFGGVAPRKGLKVKDLPEAKPPEGAETRAPPYSRLHSGEARSEYHERALRSVANISQEELSAIKAFTGSSYKSIRANEERGAPDERSKAIQSAFEKMHPEPGTTYRGLKDLRPEVINKWIEHEGTLRLGIGNVGATSSSAWHAGVSAQHGLFMGGHAVDPKSTYKVLMQIRHKSGVAVEKISSSGEDETEVLLPIDAEFRIRSIARWQGKKRILLIEIEEI